jgi:hypothetical protein
MRSVPTYWRMNKNGVNVTVGEQYCLFAQLLVAVKMLTMRLVGEKVVQVMAEAYAIKDGQIVQDVTLQMPIDRLTPAAERQSALARGDKSHLQTLHKQTKMVFVLKVSSSVCIMIRLTNVF